MKNGGKRSALRKGAKPVRKTAKRSYRPRRTFAQKVQAVISRNVENKCVQADFTGALIKNYNSSGWASDCFGIPVSPQAGTLDVTQGVGQGQRIGNTIRVKKLTMKGVLFPAPYSILTNFAPKPVEVKFWFCYQRNDPFKQPTNYASFFQNGSSSSNFTGNLLDMVKVTNKDTFRVMKTRTFKLGFDAYTVAGADTYQQSYQNNDFKMNHKFSFDLTKYIPKIMKYVDGYTAVTTRGLYLVVEAVWSNGTSSTIGQIAEIGSLMNYQLDFEYEDA